ncbi:hypothetical protein GALMADRAFT_252557 [Galerina marginata CBS 339.88]|uniref:Uncharacterized protein n=1 Tax=Galerina marginata (strain CBS 339.88) TaxID=685588 RepID=A0A067SNI5_GALM3|nr:hypothetical protein GALMADRAFT_252557 [Galerina marginata CBS 339.88]
MLRIQLRGSEQQHRLLFCWDVTTRIGYYTLVSRSVPGAVPRPGGCPRRGLCHSPPTLVVAAHTCLLATLPCLRQPKASLQ